MQLTYHALPAAVWLQCSEATDYSPQSLTSDGFIHTTFGEASLLRVLNRFYTADRAPYVALVVDLDRVSAPWTVEHNEGLDADLPHIFGPLNLDAVVGVDSIARDDAGRFLHTLSPA